MSINLMKVLADITIEADYNNEIGETFAVVKYKGELFFKTTVDFIDFGEEDEDQKAADLLIEKLAGLLQKAELND